nr:uncharacterized protein LOC109165229 [Ipomoea batatas]
MVEVLRLVNEDKKSAMGFLYNAMDEAKENIAKNLDGEEKDYNEIWEITDEKWDFHMHRHLHAAAYYLYPRCHYSPDFSTHPEIKLCLFHCLDKLIPNRDDMKKANLQCSAFHNQERFFGLTQAKNRVRASQRLRLNSQGWFSFTLSLLQPSPFGAFKIQLKASRMSTVRSMHDDETVQKEPEIAPTPPSVGTECNDEDNKNKKRKISRQRSEVWDHFTKISNDKCE